MNTGMTLKNKNMVFDIYKAAITRASKLRTATCHDRAIGNNDNHVLIDLFIIMTQFI